MKKITLFVLIVLCMISVAFAGGLLIVTTVSPTIEATFNETVVLDSYNLTAVSTGELFDLTYTTADNMTFAFKPIQSLPSGFYSFIVTAQDKIGNSKNYTKDVIVDVAQTKIGFVKPLHGISQTPDFDLVVGTTRNAVCKYSFIPGLNYTTMTNSFSDSRTQHTLANYHYPGSDETTLDLYVSCFDENNLTVSDRLEIGYDSTSPVITSVVFNQNPLTGYPPHEVITANTNDEAVCYINGAFFTSQDKLNRDSYSFNSQNIIDYTPPTIASNGQYKYTLICENLAEAKSQPQDVTITVALEENLSITVLSPGRYIKDQLIYKIATNKPAQCTATLDGANKTALSPDNASKTHSLVDGVPSENRDHVIHFECKTSSEVTSLDFVFTIDNTPPSTPIINATACKSDTISAIFSSSDNQSGIRGYNYSVTGTNVSINNTFSTAAVVDITNLKLIIGQSYLVKAFAINGAGGISSTQGQSQPIVFNPNSTTACQEKKAPDIYFNISNADIGKKILVLCSDASGCNQNSFYYGLSKTSSCNATTAGNQVVVQSDQYVCGQAADVFGNIGAHTEFVTAKAIAASCSNNRTDGTETDVDCGGSCGACDLGRKCTTNLDCSGRSCSANICVAPSCSNNRTDGLETDVDCGGTSCGVCAVGKACVSNSDCASGSCSFSVCESGTAKPVEKQTFEQWAAKYGIDPADKNGDADHDGISNYDEYVNGTDPKNAYDTPGIFMSRFLALALGLLILVMGLLFLYYFKADKQTSLNMIFIGGALLLILIVHWFFFYIPKYLVIGLSLIALGGSGYLGYTQKDIVVPKITGKNPTMVRNAKGTIEAVSPQAPRIEKEAPLTKEDLAATKQMIEMIKKEKQDREKRKNTAFSQFDGKEKHDELSPIEHVKKKLIVSEKIEKTTPLKTEKASSPLSSASEQKKMPVQKVPQKEESAFERLSNVLSGKSGTVEKLDTLSRQQTKQDAFARLSAVSKAREDVFNKLPSSSKNIDELSNKKTEKKDAKRKKR